MAAAAALGTAAEPRPTLTEARNPDRPRDQIGLDADQKLI